MQSKATTVAAYLAELPSDRRAAISAVREVILKNLDKGYEEGMSYGAIGYYVPHSRYPAGYHCDPKLPLPFAGLGSQKHYMTLGIMCHYGDGAELRWFKQAWAKTGKKLDMGKVCIRFKKLDDVPLEVIGEAIRRVPAKAYIDFYERALLANNNAAAARSAARKASAGGGAKKPAASKKAGSKKVAKKGNAGSSAKKKASRR